MSDLRRDPVTGRWVIVAPEQRHASLFDLQPASGPELTPCPFCEGSEAMTGPELLASRDGTPPNGGGWSVRVVPSRVPVLRIEGDFERRADGPYDRMRTVGAHEVVIETPRHLETFATMSGEAVARVFWACRERIRDLKRDQRFRTIVIVKNHGARAGARLAHGHTQILAVPVVPLLLEAEHRGARVHLGRKGICVFCDIVAHETEARARIVTGDERVVALAPYASRSPFETWILPRAHHARFEDASDELLASLGSTVRAVIRAFDAALVKPAFSLVVHSAAFREDVEASYHWHVEIVPRVAPVAGMEWGTGAVVNPMPPEDAAAVLRDAVAETREGATG